MSVGGYVLVSAVTQSSQKGAEDLLELELWVVVSFPPWVLGTKASPLQEQLSIRSMQHACTEAYCITLLQCTS